MFYRGKVEMVHFGAWLVGLFFLLLLVVPTTLQAERGAFLALLFLGSILVLIRSPTRWRVSKPLLFWLAICVGYSSFSIFWGVLNDAPGAISVSTVYVFWPILYLYFIGFSKNIEFYFFLAKILLVGIFIAAISGLLLVASGFYPALGILDSYFELMGGGLGLHQNFIAFSLNNMGTIIYGLPFLVTLLMLGGRALHFSSKWRFFSVVTLLVSILAMIISGRRAFVVVGLLSVPLGLMLMQWSGVRNINFKTLTKILGVVLLVAVLFLLLGSVALDLNFSGLLDNFLTGFDFDDQNNISSARRAEQFGALMGEWQSSPILGFGHGSAASSAPGDVMPWAYELQYIALLFQTGLLGLFIYGSSVVWLMYQMVALSRKYVDLAALLLPAMVGLVCFLIANATNPYLSKFDYLWTLFLPIGLANIGLLRNNSIPLSRI